jgi:hypothetical protein
MYIMKIIPKFYHAVFDYMGGLLLLAAPNLLGFAEVGGAAVWVPRVVGLMVLMQAMMTDYELGLLKVLPITMHLMADYVVALLLIASPWVFGFSYVSRATTTVIIVGLLVLVLTMMTQPRGRPRAVLA